MHHPGAGEGFDKEIDMTRSKNIEPAVQVASAVQNTMTILASRVAALGGNLTEALVRLGMGERRYTTELDHLSGVFAEISTAQVTGIIAPEGGRLYRACVLVDESMDWDAAIDAGFPNTPSNYDVRKVGDLYSPKSGIKPAKRKMILVNFGKDIPNVDIALTWGKERKLIPASPRSIWALGKHKPQLHTELGQDVLVVASLKECMFSGSRRVPYGWWHGAERGAFLFWPGGGWDVRCWFAFVCEESLAA